MDILSFLIMCNGSEKGCEKTLDFKYLSYRNSYFCFPDTVVDFNRIVCVPCTTLLYRLTPEALHTPFLPVPFQMFPFDFLSICHSLSLPL